MELLVHDDVLSERALKNPRHLVTQRLGHTFLKECTFTQNKGPSKLRVYVYSLIEGIKEHALNHPLRALI